MGGGTFWGLGSLLTKAKVSSIVTMIMVFTVVCTTISCNDVLKL